MRRDNFRLEVSNVTRSEGDGDPRQPTLAVYARVDPDELRERVGGGSDVEYSSSDVDVTFRFRAGEDENDDGGVLAVSDRVTGSFLLEIDASGADITEFVSAARRYAERTNDTSRYRIKIQAGDETIADFRKRTLLVYSSEGELLRQHSLIPSGVEI